MVQASKLICRTVYYTYQYGENQIYNLEKIAESVGARRAFDGQLLVALLYYSLSLTKLP